jgi:thiosulfate/3-mercaptopyruvate sulfurtransferase
MTPTSLSRRTVLTGGLLLAVTPFVHRIAAAQAEPYPLIVDLSWLADRATSPGLRLFDVSPLHVWKDRHIDSAAHAWWRDTVDPNYPVFGAVLTQGDDEAHRQRVLDSLELTDDDVVVYDNERGFRATRLVWFLRFLGVQHAALLNASYDDWNARAFPIDSPSVGSARPVVTPQPGYYLVTSQLLDRLGNPNLQLVDIRTDDERVDDLDGTMPLGQIPGSSRLPWSRLLNDGGHVRSTIELLELTEDAGLDSTAPTVLYGSFGVDTALPWLALSAAGFGDLQTYDRGWAEWSITQGLPRESLR